MPIVILCCDLKLHVLFSFLKKTVWQPKIAVIQACVFLVYFF